MANLALMLAIAGWLLYAYTTVQLMGEFSPAVPQDYVAQFRSNMMLMLYTALAILLISTALSVKTLRQTPWRSAICLVIVLLPLSFLAYIYFVYG